MKRKEAEALIEKYLAGNCTLEERALVEQVVIQTITHADAGTSREEVHQYKDQLRSTLTHLLQTEREAPAKPFIRRFGWSISAAAVLLAFLSVAYLFLFKPADDWQPLAATEIDPGGNRATLTLADGRTIDLDEAQTGIVVGAEDITYNDGLSSVIMLGANEASVEILALTTLKGGTYQVTLPDGTSVWLNAASTLSYPSRFHGSERRVEISGEAFFSVAKDIKRPFRVFSNGQEIEVLGTEFNISAYADDPVTKTTLVEGSVKVSHLTSHVSHLLKPGQQAITRGAEIDIQKVDTDPYTAWKDGYFAMKGSIADILNDISRWYAIEVVYAGEPADSGDLTVSFPRNKPLNQVLYMLQQADPKLRYKLEEIKETDNNGVHHTPERRLTIFR